MAINRMGDLTRDERRRFMGRKSTGRAHHRTVPDASEPTPEQLAAIPTSWDWRSNSQINYTVPIKDQGQCGSCWAFGATASVEGAWLIATGNMSSLSEQMCIDCAAGGQDTCDTGGLESDCYDQVIAQRPYSRHL